MCKVSDTKLIRAVDLLDDAVELCVTLRASESRSLLEGVVLDRLQKDLRDLRAILHRELTGKSRDSGYSWQIVGMLFATIIEFLYVILSRTLFCKLCLLRQTFIYKNHEYRKNYQTSENYAWSETEGPCKEDWGIPQLSFYD